MLKTVLEGDGQHQWENCRFNRLLKLKSLNIRNNINLKAINSSRVIVFSEYNHYLRIPTESNNIIFFGIIFYSNVL